MNAAGSALEKTYRRAQAAYPKRWRAEHGEALVGILMDIADAEHRQKASIGELVNIISNGLGVRALALTGHIAPAARDRIAVAATVIGTSFAALMLFLGEVGPWIRPGSLIWRPTGAGVSEKLVEFGPFVTLTSLVYLTWMAVFVATVARRPGLRRGLLWAVIAVSALAPLYSWLWGVMSAPVLVSTVAIACALLALAGNPNLTGPRFRFVLFGTPAAAVALLFIMVHQIPGRALFFYNARSVYPIDSQTISWGLGLGLLLISATLAVRPHHRHWPVTAAVAASPIVAKLLLPFTLTGDVYTSAAVLMVILAPVAGVLTWKWNRNSLLTVAQPA
jgi:hypothetical protein